MNKFLFGQIDYSIKINLSLSNKTKWQATNLSFLNKLFFKQNHFILKKQVQKCEACDTITQTIKLTK